MRSEASSLHASEPVVSTDHLAATGLGEAEVPSGRRPQSTEPLFPTRGRLLHATTDCRFLCRPISSIPAVRQLSAGKSVGRSDSSSGLPRGGGTVENFESIGCARRARKLCGAAHWEATYARGRKCENALELRGKRAPAEFPGQAIARESTLAQGDGVLGALGCTQRTRGSRRVGSALEWQGGATCTVEETCARDSAQAAGVCSQHAWCGGEGDCASKRAGSSAEEARICVEERAFRAR